MSVVIQFNNHDNMLDCAFSEPVIAVQVTPTDITVSPLGNTQMSGMKTIATFETSDKGWLYHGSIYHSFIIYQQGK